MSEAKAQQMERWRREREIDKVAISLGLAYQEARHGICYWHAHAKEAFRKGYESGVDNMSRKLTLETLSALCEAEPGFMSRSAKALGVSLCEIRSLTAEGKVDMFTLVEKLAAKNREAADENKVLKTRVAELEAQQHKGVTA